MRCPQAGLISFEALWLIFVVVIRPHSDQARPPSLHKAVPRSLLRASMSQTVTLQIELLYDIGASAAFVAVRYALLRIPSSVLIWLREAYELRHSQCTNSRGPA